MMNEEMDPLERCLSRQRLRQVPTEWREEIPAAAGRESRAETALVFGTRPSTPDYFVASSGRLGGTGGDLDLDFDSGFFRPRQNTNDGRKDRPAIAGSHGPN